MGTLYIVRHGQASFGAADYDRLSDLGHRQSRRLGEHFRARGLAFERVLTGTLRRHRETFAGIAEGMGIAAEAIEFPGLNEYDSEAVVCAVHPQPMPPPDSPESVRQHFRVLRQGLAAWMAGTAQPQGMPVFADFAAGVRAALDHVREHCEGDALIVSSGGPIAVAMSHVLGLDAATTIELNLRIRNSAVTEFSFNPKRHLLVAYNGVPHLEQPGFESWVTYA
jgi:broad specificity phosphatase PhoE